MSVGTAALSFAVQWRTLKANVRHLESAHTETRAHVTALQAEQVAGASRLATVETEQLGTRLQSGPPCSFSLSPWFRPSDVGLLVSAAGSPKPKEATSPGSRAPITSARGLNVRSGIPASTEIAWGHLLPCQGCPDVGVRGMSTDGL